MLRRDPKSVDGVPIDFGLRLHQFELIGERQMFERIKEAGRGTQGLPKRLRQIGEDGGADAAGPEVRGPGEDALVEIIP